MECKGKKSKVASFHFAVSKPTYFHLLTGVRSPTEPTCKVVFENEQDMHHFESILKEHNDKEHKFEFQHDDEFSIKTPLEFLDKIKVMFEL